METDVRQKIESRQTVVGVIGLGYVGLPLAGVFARGGFTVLGFDIDPGKIKAIEGGENYLKHLGEEFVRGIVATGRFSATTDFERLGEADAVIICVPTPLGQHLEPDLSYVVNTAQAVARTLRRGQLVVLESTTFPTTTRAVVLPCLEATGLACGKDFFLAFSPEREDPGRKDHSTRSIPKLVGGVDAISGELAVALYGAVLERVVPVRNAEVAESAKLLENIYRAVNIAMVNEMKMLLGAMGIDVWEVIDAAATKPFGFQAFYPGPGLGGHCVPIDPYYLTWKAREVGMSTRFIELAGDVNRMMPEYVVHQVVLALNEERMAVHGARVLVLGLAYKPDVDDVRESPSFELIEKLQALGAQVDYHDPHVPATRRMRNYDLGMRSIELTDAALAFYDCVLIATHHAAYDWQQVADHARLVVDTRGVMRGIALPRARVINA